MRESRLERHFAKRIKNIGGISFKFVSPGTAGVPDRIVLYSGCTYFVELKTTSAITKLQQKVHQLFRSKGVDVRIIRTYQQIEDFLNEITQLSADGS